MNDRNVHTHGPKISGNSPGGFGTTLSKAFGTTLGTTLGKAFR